MGDSATHLIIVGPARSGTTVLLNALNTSGDICMLGEPFSYRDDGEADFRARFNRKHKRFANQISKSTYAPRLPGLSEHATAPDYFKALSRHYAIYGEKISLSNPRFGSDFPRLQDWLEDHRPRCLFVFRRPADVLYSAAGLFKATTLIDTIYYYALTVRLYLNIARVLPEVRHVLHSEISEATFQVLGRWLNADLSCAAACYDAERLERRHPEAEIAEIETLNLAYDFLSKWEAFDGLIAPALLQTEQKLSGENGNELGRLYAKVDALILSLGQDHQQNNAVSDAVADSSDGRR